MHYPLEEGKELLTEIVSIIDSPHINLVPSMYTEGEALFAVMKENNMESMVAKRLGTPYLPGTRSDNWRKIINWSYHDVLIAKVTHGPLTAQLQNIEDEYLGSVTIGFTREIKVELHSRTPPFFAKVKARGWTSGKKLRLPQIVEIK
jgi:DNA ligase 1